MNDSRPAYRSGLQHNGPRRGGFTLVEVVIALAIFVFGALAIIRIFPPALGVIQNSGDRLVAYNLNRTLLNSYNNIEPPEAVYDTAAEAVPANWNSIDGAGFPGAVAGTRNNNSLPYQNAQDFSGSALGHYRNIVAEHHTLPGNGLLYTQFPIETIGTLPTVKAYQEFNVTGAQVARNGNLDFTNALLDPSGIGYIPASTDKVYATYRYQQNGRFWDAHEEAVDTTVLPLTVTSLKVVQANTTVGTSNSIVSGEVTIRVRRLLNIASANGDLGQITFSTPFTSPLAVGSDVSFDYTVKDWRWLVSDSIPTNTPEEATTPATDREVGLPVKFLDTEASPFFYTAYPMAPTSVSTTIKYTNSTDTEYDSNTDMQKSGKIPFTVDQDETRQPPARIVYRTLDNWAQQLSVAAKHYTQYYVGGPVSPEPWRECVLGNDKRYIYFHPGEAGKTVQLSYSLGDPTATNAAGDTQISGQMLTIDTQVIPTPADCPAAFAANEGNVARLQILGVNGYLIGQQVTALRQIDGVSVQSRTAWIDGSRYTQAIATRLRQGDTK